MGLRPLAFDVEGDTLSLSVCDGAFVATRQVPDEAMVVELDAIGFSDLVQDQRSATAFLTAGNTTVRNGSIFDFVRWDPVLRALIDGRPVHEPGMVSFADTDGRPLDLRRSFTPADSDDAMAHFLAEAGFLHLRGWFDPLEVSAVSAEIDAALPAYRPDDKRAWWAKTAAGDHRAVRLLDIVDHSPTLRLLLESDRHRRIAELTADGHTSGSVTGRSAQALIKPIDVVKGISDVPWHKDCSLGRHSYSCCSMTVGISVTASDADSGQLCVLAGSHRANVQTLFVDDIDLPRIPLPTEPGDVTVHLSCTMHMSMPPRVRERRVVYTGFRLPALGDRDPAGARRMYQVIRNAPNTISQDLGYRGYSDAGV